VLLLVFAGCSQPTDFTYSGASPGNPGSLTADVSYEGLVLLSWRQVASASKYVVYRYDTVTKKERLLGEVENVVPTASDPSLYYTDFVGRNNQLEDGRNYEYTVVAVNNSFGQSGMPLKNGSSKVSAKPKIPAEGSAVTANLDVEITAGGSILVKFTNQPNLNYSVSYQYGGGELVGELTGSAATQAGNAWIFEKTRYLTIPSFEGKGVVTVGYSFAGGGWLTGGTAATEAIDIPIGADGPGAITSFSVFRGEDTVSPFTRYTWEGGEGATKFEIYKAPVSEEPAFGGLGGTVSIKFLDDWELVKTSPPEQNLSLAWVAKEIADTNTLNYVYLVKAINDAGSTSKFGYKEPAILPVPTLNVTVRYNAVDEIQISWEGDEDTEYHLYRAVVDPLDADDPTATNNFILRDPGEYEEVIFDKPRYVLGWAVIVDKPEPGEAYVYKLIASKWGATSVPAIKVINTDDGVFTNQANFSIAKIISNDKAKNNEFDALSVRITYEGHELLADKARTIKVYRRVAGLISAGSASPYEPLTTVNWPADADGDGITINDNVPDVSLEYIYRIVVTNPGSSVEVPNFQAVNGVTETTPETAYSYDYILNQSIFTVSGTHYTAGNVLYKFTGITPETNKTLDATGAASWTIPPSALIIDTGRVQVMSSSNIVYDGGPSIKGLPIKLGWGIHAGLSGGEAAINASGTTFVEKEAWLTVEWASVELANTPGTDQTTTWYIYYVVLDPPSSHGTFARNDEPTWGGYDTPSDPEQYNDDWLVVKEYPWTDPDTKPVAATDKLGYTVP
jgi:hypothetical protein